MYNVSYVLAERFNQDLLETFANNVLLELENITDPSITLLTLFEIEKYSSQ